MLIVMFEKQNINTVTFFVNWKECFENSLESVSLYQNGLYTKKLLKMEYECKHVWITINRSAYIYIYI